MARVLATAKVEGLERLQYMLKTFPTKTRGRLRDVLRVSAEAVADDARRQVRYVEGNLHDAIAVVGRGLLWKAGIEDKPDPGRGGDRIHQNPSAYAHLVEYGTSDTGAKPFMKPAAEGEGNRLVGRIRVLSRVLETEAEE